MRIKCRSCEVVFQANASNIVGSNVMGECPKCGDLYKFGIVQKVEQRQEQLMDHIYLLGFLGIGSYLYSLLFGSMAEGAVILGVIVFGLAVMAKTSNTINFYLRRGDFEVVD